MTQTEWENLKSGDYVIHNDKFIYQIISRHPYVNHDCSSQYKAVCLRFKTKVIIYNLSTWQLLTPQEKIKLL